ncbi:MAG: hypothetical protein COA59_05920 [Colwellia sp.]|nr:MAG: hypothetical protein COA59_05920 [Colwellia sp.]
MHFIGLWSEHANSYLLVITVITFFTFSLLLFLKPLLWAKMFQWKIPEDTDLTVYFARCLGAFAIMTNALFLRVIISGTGADLMLEFFTGFCVFMVVVHIWGAIEGSQPMIETLETGFWALLVILGLLFYPGELI